MNDHTARMLAEAEARLHDADVLSRSLVAESDSACLLRILALEVLLKAALHAKIGKFKRSHDYRSLWGAFDAKSQAAILKEAEALDPGRISADALPALLTNWEFVFRKARYYYEFYENYTLQEQRDLGELWIALGAPESEAEVRYCSEELRALIHGLIVHIRNAA
jgi:HEPN domain-containing protein